MSVIFAVYQLAYSFHRLLILPEFVIIHVKLFLKNNCNVKITHLRDCDCFVYLYFVEESCSKKSNINFLMGLKANAFAENLLRNWK